MARPDLSAIEACDVALEQVAGLEVVAALVEPEADEDLVKACKTVLSGLLDVRFSLPQQRTTSEGAPSCTVSPSVAP